MLQMSLAKAFWGNLAPTARNAPPEPSGSPLGYLAAKASTFLGFRTFCRIANLNMWGWMILHGKTPCKIIHFCILRLRVFVMKQAQPKPDLVDAIWCDSRFLTKKYEIGQKCWVRTKRSLFLKGSNWPPSVWPYFCVQENATPIKWHHPGCHLIRFGLSLRRHQNSHFLTRAHETYAFDALHNYGIINRNFLFLFFYRQPSKMNGFQQCTRKHVQN